MARISASIPDDLKDELYQAASDANQAISHVIVEALRAHLDGGGTSSGGSTVGNGRTSDDSLHRRLDTLTQEIEGLKELMTSRTPPKGVRFF